MAMSDTLGDMLTRIRNGQSANKAVVEAPASRFRGNVLDVLKREGYIRDFSKFEKRPGIHCLLYTSPSPRDMRRSRMPSSA